MRVAELWNYLQGDTHKSHPTRVAIVPCQMIGKSAKAFAESPKSPSNATRLLTFYQEL